MKQEVVPTSPKSEHRKKEKQPQLSLGAFVSIVIATAVIGMVAGFFGFAFATAIPPQWPILGDLNIVTLLDQDRQDVLLSTRRIQQQPIVRQHPQIVDQIAVVFEQEPTIEEPSTIVGNAAVVSTDGWMVMPTSIFPGITQTVNDLAQPAVIIGDGVVVSIVQAVEDAFTGMTFFQVEANSGQVVTFSSDTTVSVGQSVTLLEKNIGAYVAYERRAAGDEQQSNAFRTTSSLQQRTILDPIGEADRVGSPIFGSNGDLVGIVVDSDRYVPAAVIRGAFQSLVANNNSEIVRSELSIEYMNVARLTTSEREDNNIPETGIYISSILSENTGLEEGDVIRAINTTPVTDASDFSTIIHSQAPNTTLGLTIWRNGAEQIVDLNL